MIHNHFIYSPDAWTRDFSLKQVFFVQKQYYWRVSKVFVVAYRVKEPQTFVHAILGFIFDENLYRIWIGNYLMDLKFF